MRHIRQRTHHAVKQSHADQSADLPVTQARPTRPSHPARYPRRSPAPHSRRALLSKPAPKAKPDTPHAFPSRRRRLTRSSCPTRYLPRSPAPPFPQGSPLQPLLPLLRQNPAHPALPHHAGTDPHGPAAQPAIFPVTNSLIPAQLSYPIPAPTPKVKPGTPHASPPRRHRPTRPSRPARYLSRHQLPHSRIFLPR